MGYATPLGSFDGQGSVAGCWCCQQLSPRPTRLPYPARSVFGGLSGDYGVEVADGQVRVGTDRLELELALLV